MTGTAARRGKTATGAAIPGSSARAAENTLSEILKGENLEGALKYLSESERRLLEQLVAEIRTGKHGTELLDQLWTYDYLRKPPSMEQFLTDDYWMGRVARMTEDNAGVWPTWSNILTEDWDLNSRIHNCVITGSLGIGKTWNMVLILLYRIVVCSLLRNPTNFVGLSSGSRIIYVLMSVTQAQVQDTAFGDAMAFMSRSPYFIEELRFNPNAKYSSGVVDLGPTIQLNSGSKGQHIIGRNTLGIGMDEGNFRLESDPDMKAYKLFNEIRTRIKNRFQRATGILPAVSIIASSARDESAFTENVIGEIVKADDPKSEKVYRQSIYTLKSSDTWLGLGCDAELVRLHANRYSGTYFKVSYGLKTVSPTVLSGSYDADGQPIGHGHENAPTGSRIELVPIEYLPEFERDTVRALQNLSGISIGGAYRLFTSMVDFERCIELGDKAGLTNPCTVPIIPLSDEDDREIWDFLDHPKFLQRVSGVVRPKFHPGAARYAHMDLATRSYAGLSIGHLVGWSEVKDVVGADGQLFNDKRLMFQYDMVLTITAGRTKPISQQKINRFFLWLRDMAGFQFSKISADQFQSVMQLQSLESQGFSTGNLSLDRTKSPYYAWRSGIEEHRVIMFRQGRMYEEAEKLIDGPAKVDHPIATSGEYTGKDTTDSAAGAYYNAISDPAPDLSGLNSPFINDPPPTRQDVGSMFVMPPAPVRRAPRTFIIPN